MFLICLILLIYCLGTLFSNKLLALIKYLFKRSAIFTLSVTTISSFLSETGLYGNRCLFSSYFTVLNKFLNLWNNWKIAFYNTQISLF